MSFASLEEFYNIYKPHIHKLNNEDIGKRMTKVRRPKNGDFSYIGDICYIKEVILEDRRCDRLCCKNIGVLKCGRCMNSFYCSKECQISMWKLHKPFCSDKTYKRDNLKQTIVELKIGKRFIYTITKEDEEYLEDWIDLDLIKEYEETLYRLLEEWRERCIADIPEIKALVEKYNKVEKED